MGVVISALPSYFTTQIAFMKHLTTLHCHCRLNVLYKLNDLNILCYSISLNFTSFHIMELLFFVFKKKSAVEYILPIGKYSFAKICIVPF